MCYDPAMAEYSVAAVPRPAHGEPESLQFPGCRPVRIARAEIANYERRIEYWDAATETAMVCEPVSVYHEHPPQRLAGLLKTIAHVRGSQIETFGAADLLVRDAHGARLRILQADQTVYLHPRATRPWGPAIEVGSDLLPDVVLEVDANAAASDAATLTFAVKVQPPSSSYVGCSKDAETWRGLRVCTERPRDGYDRDAFGTGYRTLEDDIIAALPATMKEKWPSVYALLLHRIRNHTERYRYD